MTLPECGDYPDVERLDGQQVVLVGTYEQVDVRARPRPPAVHAGHAAVRLRDGHLVLIEPMWSEQALRSHHEIARADGKNVRVSGVIRARSPEPAEPAAFIAGPCITEVVRVDAV